MKKLVAAFLLLTVVVAAAMYLLNRPVPTPTATSLLPADTLLLARVSDFPASRAKLAASPLGAFWRDSGVQTMLAPALSAMTNTSLAVDPDKLWQLPQGEAFIAVTHLTTVPETVPAFVAGMDVKNRRRDLEHFLQQAPTTAKAEVKTYLGVSYTHWQFATNQQACHTFLGTLFVAASDEDGIRDVITRYKRPSPADAPALGATAAFQTALQQVPGATEGSLYLNVEPLLKQYGALLLMAGPNAQGLANLQRFVSSFTCAPEGIRDENVTSFAKPRPLDPPLSLHTLDAAPTDTAFYSAGNADLAGGYKKLMTLLAASGNPQAAGIGSAIDKFLAQAGVRLTDDFLAHLGPELAYLSRWRDGAASPDFAIVVEVKNQAVAAKFDKIVAAIGEATHSLETVAHNGEKLHVIHAGTATPTLVLTEKLFILALNAEYAKAIVAQSKAGTGGLAGSPEYSAALRGLPANGHSLTYCDLRQMVGNLYVFAHKQETAAPWFKLPPAETVTRYLGTYASVTVETDRASRTLTRSNLGKPATLMVALAGGIAAAQPWLAQLPPMPIPGLPSSSSGTAAPPPPAGNRRATSQTPAP